MQTASSHTAASGLGAGPVIASTVMPHSRARRAAATALGCGPDVDSSTSTSPARPCASTWRANSSSAG
jgi:hypothetical protein